tara:strand:- start:682 stop:1668 length:987 start_codon:yes stop_codon:yes gene_type:complete
MSKSKLDVPRLDREMERVLGQLDAILGECTVSGNPFDRAMEVSGDYLTDLQDGEQDRSDSSYRAMDAGQFTLANADALSTGDLADQLAAQESDLQKRTDEATARTAELLQEEAAEQERLAREAQLAEKADKRARQEAEDAHQATLRQQEEQFEETYGGKDKLTMAAFPKDEVSTATFYLRDEGDVSPPITGQEIIDTIRSGIMSRIVQVSPQADGPWELISEGPFGEFFTLSSNEVQEDDVDLDSEFKRAESQFEEAKRNRVSDLDLEDLPTESFFLRRGSSSPRQADGKSVISNIKSGNLKETDEVSLATDGPWERLSGSPFAKYFW